MQPSVIQNKPNIWSMMLYKNFEILVVFGLRMMFLSQKMEWKI
ncbi:hypothetical protein X975_12811, partial [Stegodyphus mimosarum]